MPKKKVVKKKLTQVLFLLGLLGIRQYGVHMNGYIYDADNELKMWIGRRSLTKPTYPGMLDNTVGKLCHCTRYIGEPDRLTLTGDRPEVFLLE